MNYNILFEAVREIVGRGLSMAETAVLREAIADSAPAPAPALALTIPGSRRIGAAGIALIKQFEGCGRRTADGRFAAYPDPGTGAEPWTIGWGATGNGIAPGTVWTAEECDARLEADLARYAADVDRAVGDAPTTQPQFDALVSFHYNTGAIARATLTKRHKAGNHAAAAAQFARWNMAGGKVLRGLVRRRAAEARLYADTER